MVRVDQGGAGQHRRAARLAALAASPPQTSHREPAYYVCAGPTGLPLVALVRVAGSRWQVEEAFQAGKGLCGLDQHQVRRWRRYRWVTLAMLAYAFLVVARSPSTPNVRRRHGWSS